MARGKTFAERNQSTVGPGTVAVAMIAMLLALAFYAL